MNNENTAQGSANSREDNNPLVNKLDDICERLELLEAIAELFHLWELFACSSSSEIVTESAVISAPHSASNRMLRSWFRVFG